MGTATAASVPVASVRVEPINTASKRIPTASPGRKPLPDTVTTAIEGPPLDDKRTAGADAPPSATAAPADQATTTITTNRSAIRDAHSYTPELQRAPIASNSCRCPQQTQRGRDGACSGHGGNHRAHRPIKQRTISDAAASLRTRRYAPMRTLMADPRLGVSADATITNHERQQACNDRKPEDQPV